MRSLFDTLVLIRKSLGKVGFIILILEGGKKYNGNNCTCSLAIMAGVSAL
jgi:hypothetical protein